MDYLVTGGAGFIGSNAVQVLLEQGRSVRVLDDLSTGRARNLDGVRQDIEFIEGDIRDPSTVARAVSGVEHVLHFGALPSVVRSVEDPVTANDVNINGTLTVLVAARDAGVRRLVFSSSSSVYGDTLDLPKHEGMLPRPLSPYAVQKLTGEHYCAIFHQLYGLGAFVLRYFNVFGPHQDPTSQYGAVIPNFITALRHDRSPTIYGDGEQTRDFTFVRDVVRANLCCCAADDAAAGRIYNVAYDQRTSINDLAHHITRIMGKAIRPSYEPPRPGDVRDSQGDPTAAREVLGWQPETTVAKGLESTVAYFLEAE